ncbi:MAG: hypothetical protein EXQ55_09605 [Acidobacteria bacterium]|nr:hypothetical protein [Acidobacteriota bacterium]
MILVLCACCTPEPAAAQAPPIVTRSPDGAITIRAVRIQEPIRLDGRLDERVYSEETPFVDFIQQEPHEGSPATEKTEAWIFFDERNIYISARCWDSQPEREIANEMRRDSNNIIQNESLTIIFDSFHDKRNGVFFQTNALGALRDASSTDERSQNTDWNAVWDVRTQRSSEGWTAEFVIPFRSLRYGPGREQTWGINLRRIIGWKSEWVYLSPPPAYLGMPGIVAVSKAATLVGLEAPPSRPALELKPYLNFGVRTDLAAREPFRNDAAKQLGGDVKYSITKNLTLDLTYNTDFAQVEDDTQQVNLTRFNLQFPERREFFLEGQGLFTFGGGAGFAGGGGFGGGGSSNNTPVLFFSRRIGLNNGRPVPIAGGGRLTGQVGPYSVGLLNIHSEADVASASKATNFSVLRLKRNVLRRSNIGLLYTRRMETGEGAVGPGETFGVDGLYSLSTSLNVNGYFAGTTGNTMESRKENRSHQLAFDYTADRYGFQAQQVVVGRNFNPQVGFLRRTDFRRQFVQARFSPRPSNNHWKGIRRFVYQANVEHIENNDGRLDFREQEAQFLIEQVNGDRLNVDFTRDYEFIPRAFEISRGVSVPVGAYTYNNLLTSYTLGTRRFLSGSVSFQQGQLYGGTKRSVGLSGGRLELSSQLALEPSVSINWVRLPFGDFTQTVITERTTYTVSPRMFVSALTQYASSSRAFSVNARLRWEYRPLSELFVVYSDGRDTTLNGFPHLVNRAFIVKINKLFRL